MRPRTALCLLLGLALAWPMAAAPGDIPPPDNPTAPRPVLFEAADHIPLRGIFYPSLQGKNAPCALFLHKIGGSCQQEGWDMLATELQRNGFAVLRFDFRGHGNSVVVRPEFWQQPMNRQLRVARPDSIISYRDFPPAYYPILANDIAAAKLFLDQMNDAGECNSANLLIVGAEDGAALGALWLALEWRRHRILDGNRVDPVPQARDVIGAIWLGITPHLGTDPNLGTRPMPVADWIIESGRDHGVPMVFLHGEADDAAANFARRCLQELKSGSGNKLTSALPVLRSGKLTGQQLLDRDLKLKPLVKEEPQLPWIVNYANQLKMAHLASDWEPREPDKTPSVFKFPGHDVPATGLLPIELMGER